MLHISTQTNYLSGMSRESTDRTKIWLPVPTKGTRGPTVVGGPVLSRAHHLVYTGRNASSLLNATLSQESETGGRSSNTGERAAVVPLAWTSFR